MSTTMTKSAPWYNPFTLTYPNSLYGVEVHEIFFYKDGKVVATTRWFSNGNNGYKSIELPFDVKRANKLNLDRKDAFTIKPQNGWCDGYDLYIHADLMPSFKSLGRTEGRKTWYDTETHETFEITLHGKEDGDMEIKDHTITFQANFEFDYTDEFKKCVKMSQDIKETCGVEISEYRMHDVLQHYNISKKRKSNP